MLYLRMFGDVQLTNVDGTAVPLSRQQLALLSILAVASPGAVPRSRMRELLWPISGSKQGRQSLSQTVYAINALCPNLIGRPRNQCLVINELSVSSDYRRLFPIGLVDPSEPGTIDQTGRFLGSLADYPSDTFDEWRAQIESAIGRERTPEAQTGATGAIAEESPPLRKTMVGRAAEFDLARRTWQECLKGRTRVIVVAGESGSGKTRFCQHLTRYLILQGAKVSFSHCSLLNVDRPHAVACQLMRATETASIVDDGGGNPSLEMQLDAAALLLADRPRTIVIEDIQWIDDGSAVWLERLLRRADDWPLLVILTVTIDDPREADRALQRVASGGHTSCWIAMRTLSTPVALNVIAAEESAAGLVLEAEVRKRIVHVAQGSPLFLTELAKDALLQKAEDVPIDVRLDTMYPQTVDAALRRRLARLPARTARAMAVIAILGGSSTEDEISDILELSREETATTAHELESFGLLAESRPSLTLRNDLFRHAAEHLVGPIDRAVYHNRIAERLTRLGGQQLNRIARHYHAAGRLEEARQAGLSSAEHDERRGLLQPALASLMLAETASIDEAERVEVAIKRARLLCLTNEYTRALGVLEPIEAATQRQHNSFGVALLDLARALALFEGGRIASDDTRQRLEDLLATFTSNADEAIIGHTIRYLLASAHASGSESIIRWIIHEVSAGSLAAVDRSGELHVLAANAEAVYGEPASAHQLLDVAEALGCRGSNVAEHLYLLVRGIAFYVGGDLNHAREILESALRRPDTGLRRDIRAKIAANLGVVYLESGELGAARAALDMAHRLSSKNDVLGVLANQAAWCVHSGRYDLLASTVSELENSNLTLRVGWIAIACDSFQAYWYLHHGYRDRAFEIADRIADHLDPSRRDLTDSSYSEVIVARCLELRNRQRDAIERLSLVAQELPTSHWAGRLRVQSELARLLRRSDPVEADRLTLAVRKQAHVHGAYAHIRQLEQTHAHGVSGTIDRVSRSSI